MHIRVFATPALLCQQALEDAAAVVIDALRMTSVAAIAIANGCCGLMTAASVEEARALAKEHSALLGGERNAEHIPGFDLSNSPLDYTRDRVEGRKLVMTTTNGTQAIAACSGARRLLLGGFVNASAVAAALAGEETVALVCAGTYGAFTLEDALAAGAIVQRLKDMGAEPECNDMGIAADLLHRVAKADLHATLAQTRHYRRLRKLGMEQDLQTCLTEDSVKAVPQKQANGWIA